MAVLLAAAFAVGVLLNGNAQPAAAPASAPATSGNPIFPGWYADPEARVFGKEFWIYPTYSARYEQQFFFDAFSSPDLVHWTKHSHVMDTNGVPWAHRAIWAPAVAEKDGRYFIFFGANDIQNDQQFGGIGVAVADQPAGPFKDYLGKPLIDKFHNGAQPIDPFVFRDNDGQAYLIYGGWRHCNICRLKADFTGFEPFADGTTFKEITPKGYVEGSVMFRRGAKYYFMWSKAAGPGRIIPWPTRWRMRRPARSRASAKFSSRIPRSPPALAITRSSSCRAKKFITSSIIAGRWAKPTATIA